MVREWRNPVYVEKEGWKTGAMEKVMRNSGPGGQTAISVDVEEATESLKSQDGKFK